jgi:hypothetical protein
MVVSRVYCLPVVYQSPQHRRTQEGRATGLQLPFKIEIKKQILETRNQAFYVIYPSAEMSQINLLTTSALE